MTPPDPAPTPAFPRLVVARSPLAVEQSLLRDLDALLPSSFAELAGRRDPIRVVVPSGSLRAHLLTVLARRRGAALGVEVLTLRRAALAILAGAGVPVPGGEALWEVLARRAAAAERSLDRALGDLADGWGAATASMRDLLDAGFEPALLEPLLETLADSGPGDQATERACSLLRATAAAGERMAELGCGRSSDLLRRAAAVVQARGPEALPAHALLIHGFADATGVATDLIEALLRHGPARLYLDLPPAAGAVEDAGPAAFGQRFRERLAGVAPSEAAALAPNSASLVEIAAPGAEAEVRAVGRAIAELLAAGVEPETIGVVARDLGPYVAPLRDAWQQLGIAYSGEGPSGLVSPLHRRLAALLALLAERERSPVERWLALSPRAGGEATAFELRLALHGLGAARLSAAAELEPTALPAAGDLPLPLRTGLADAADAEEAAAPRAPRRRVRRRAVERALGAARRLVALLAAWPERAPLERHLARFARLRAELRLDATDEVSAEIEAAVATLRQEVPLDLPLDREEWVLLLRRCWLTAGEEPLGGRGGGVQVLSVTEARARTFAHLFVLGLERGRFPRPVGEDPLLPDSLRHRLAVALPDLAPKLAGRDEEVFLFAQLLAAAPTVTLSRRNQDEDGRRLAPSALLERLRWSGRLAEPVRPVPARPALMALAAGARAPLPPAEAAIAAALILPRARLRPWLEAALADAQAAGGSEAPAVGAASLAASHLAVLGEMDLDLEAPEGRRLSKSLGPYFGFLGPPTGRADPRRAPPHVTRMESLARCAWQTLLTRLLALEPVPDPGGAVPALGAQLTGSLVHRVLEEIGRAALAPFAGGDLAAALARGPVPVSWPDDAALTEWALRAARELLAEEGLSAWSLDRALVAASLPRLWVARDRDRRRDTALGGVELEGRLALGAGEAETVLPFRCDRLEWIDGRPALIDFKTGAAFLQKVTETTRREKLLQAIACGERLQVPVYAAALTTQGGEGRFVQLIPEAEADDRTEIALRGDDHAAMVRLEATVATLRRALEAGALFPRLLDSNLETAGPACRSCTVVEACVQHDSGARRRFAAAVAAGRAGDGPPPRPAEAALLDLFDLGRPAAAPAAESSEEPG